ncbi:MAG: BlaI/MecI/CopY family transcriptional regulator [Lachnospiraceae bacterium]|jgi:BlaI family penicillinase repressor|nr:BlaI/MecI/CopY family transcriptional regulator [Lachnospiraceae bacterium]
MKKKITDAELELMKLFWRESPRPLTFSDLRELEQTMGWKKTTIQTHMVHLRDKGILKEVPGYDKRGDVAHYIATVTEDEFLAVESDNLLHKFFGGSAMKMVAALRQGGKLSNQEIDALREYFRVEEEE